MDRGTIFSPMFAQSGNLEQIPILQDRPFGASLDAGGDQLEQDRAELLF